jgi:hypothetical protein
MVPDSSLRMHLAMRATGVETAFGVAQLHANSHVIRYLSGR